MEGTGGEWKGESGKGIKDRVAFQNTPCRSKWDSYDRCMGQNNFSNKIRAQIPATHFEEEK